MPRRTELAHEEYVEGRTERVGDLKRHWHAAPQEGEDERISSVIRKFCGKLPPCVCAIPKKAPSFPFFPALLCYAVGLERPECAYRRPALANKVPIRDKPSTRHALRRGYDSSLGVRLAHAKATEMTGQGYSARFTGN
jgi:hypothetical protein